MIKGLSDRLRLPRRGKIRLGEKKISKKTGKEYPVSLDYFVVPDEVKKVYSDKPRKLDIMIPMENRDAFFPQNYKMYGKSKGLICLSKDSEILTNNGWSGLDQVAIGHSALTMNIATDTFEEQFIEKKIILEYKGDLLNFKTKSLDALVTPDHRIVYRHRRGTWMIKRASEAPYKNVLWPISKPVKKIGLNISDDLLTLLGWIISDGTIQKPSWARTHNRPVTDLGNRLTPEERSLRVSYLTISQSKPQYIDEITILLKRLFNRVSYSKVKNNGGPLNRQQKVLPSVRFFLGNKESPICFGWLEENIHRIPRQILAQASAYQLHILFNSLVKGDGSDDEKHGIRFHAGKNKELADDFQELCTRLGYKSSISRDSLHPTTIGQYIVYVSKRVTCHCIKKKPTKIPYNGKVWCIVVPNGTFVVRRSGRVFATGNCRGDGETATRVDPKSHELSDIECLGKNCEYFKEGKEIEGHMYRCNTIGNLQVILPKIKGLGIYQIDTSSYNSIVNINSGIAMIRGMPGMGGRISWIPLVLEVKMQEAHPTVKGKKITTNIPVMSLTANVTPEELLARSMLISQRIEQRLPQPTVEQIKELTSPEVSIDNPKLDEKPDLLYTETEESPQKGEIDNKIEEIKPADEGKEAKQQEEGKKVDEKKEEMKAGSDKEIPEEIELRQEIETLFDQLNWPIGRRIIWQKKEEYDSCKTIEGMTKLRDDLKKKVETEKQGNLFKQENKTNKED